MEHTTTSEGISAQETTPTQTTGATEAQQSQEQQQASAQPQVEDMQRQMQELQAKLNNTEQSARYYQSQYDKARNAVASFTGHQQASQEPSMRDKLASFYKSKGYNPDDVLPVVEPLLENVFNPLMGELNAVKSQLAAQSAYQQASQHVGAAVQQAMSDDNITFANPAIQQAALAATQQFAAEVAKNGQAVDMETLRIFALNVAWQERGKMEMASRRGGQQQAPPKQQPVNINGMFGFQPGFPQGQQPAAPRQQTDYQRGIQSEIDAMFGGKP